jgi:diacylglycerol kinase family enzyme
VPSLGGPPTSSSALSACRSVRWRPPEPWSAPSPAPSTSAYRCPQLELTADGHPLQATFFGICNLPLYGGPFRLAPEARPDDGRLDLVLFRGDTRGATLAFALDLVRGRHVARADTSFFQVGEVRLPERPLQAQLDGDPRLLRGALVRLADEPLTVLAPRGRQSPSRNSANDTRT